MRPWPAFESQPKAPIFNTSGILLFLARSQVDAFATVAAMRQRTHASCRIVLALLICFVVFRDIPICAGQDSAGKTLLKVNLFPYLPHGSNGFQQLTARIKQEFAKANPGVELQLTLDDNDSNNFYSLENYKKWLQEDYDVVEPDTLFLTALVNAGLIDAWPDPDIANWPRPDKSAARVRGKTYAMPHWLCGYFIFTRNHTVAAAKDGDSLVAALAAADAALTKITGNFKSTWDSPCLYLDCWEETYAPKDPSIAVSTNLDSEVIRELRQFAKQGESNGRNPCLDGTYKDNKKAAIQFANRQTEATFGFSETLFYILSNAPNDGSVTIHSLNLGKAEHPLLFMDGFVLRRGLTEPQRRAALRFVEYMEDPATYRWIIMGEDIAENRVPRYLIPAMNTAFQVEPIKSNSYYKVIFDTVQEAEPFPNDKVPELHNDMSTEILTELEKP
jgi:thiamine pyridinylase